MFYLKRWNSLVIHNAHYFALWCCGMRAEYVIVCDIMKLWPLTSYLLYLLMLLQQLGYLILWQSNPYLNSLVRVHRKYWLFNRSTQNWSNLNVFIQYSYIILIRCLSTCCGQETKTPPKRPPSPRPSVFARKKKRDQ